MPAFDTFDACIPAHWIAALLYGDTCHLSEIDSACFWQWHDDTVKANGGRAPSVGTVKSQPYFCKYHDGQPYGVLPCECYDVVFQVSMPTLWDEPASERHGERRHTVGTATEAARF